MQQPRSLRSARRGAPRLVAGLGALVVVVGLLAGPAVAQSTDDPEPPKTRAEQEQAEEALLETLDLEVEDPPPAPDDPFAEVVTTTDLAAKRALARIDATSKSDKANLDALVAVGELQAEQKREAAAVKVRSAAIAELGDERERLSDLTVQAYVTGGSVDIEQFRAFVEGDTTDPAAGREIMFSQVLDRQRAVTEQATKDLRAARAKLKEIRLLLAAAEAKAVRLLGIAADRTARRVAAETAHIEAAAAAEDAQGRLRSAGNLPIFPVDVGAGIIGMPRLSAEDLATWFAGSAYRPRVTTPIEDYARWFIEEGRAEGIRGDIAFAQAVLETGGFANNDTVLANNFSGIGHCDSCPSGWKFPSPQMGVRAQIQLLKSYAVKKPNYANDLVDKRLRGPAGCCQTWGDLTTVWATDPTYGPKVMLLYTAMVDHALDRRARGEGFEAPAALPVP